MYLAKKYQFSVTGVSISNIQIEMASKTAKEQNLDSLVQFVEMDGEKIGEKFEPESFDIVWISEALSHFPNKQLFFQNAFKLLKKGGQLVVADWFKADHLNEKQMIKYIAPIEGLIYILKF